MYLNLEPDQQRALRRGAQLLAKELKKAKGKAQELGVSGDSFDAEIALLEGSFRGKALTPGLVHALSEWEAVETPKVEQGELLDLGPWVVEKSNAGAWRVIRSDGKEGVEIWLSEKGAIGRAESLNIDWRAAEEARRKKEAKEEAVLEERAELALQDGDGPPAETENGPDSISPEPTHGDAALPDSPANELTAEDELHLWVLNRHPDQLIDGKVPPELREALLSVDDWSRYRAVCKDFQMKIRRIDFEPLEDLLKGRGEELRNAPEEQPNPVLESYLDEIAREDRRDEPVPADHVAHSSPEELRAEPVTPGVMEPQGDFAVEPDPSDYTIHGPRRFYIRESKGAPGQYVIVDRQTNSARGGALPEERAKELAERFERDPEGPTTGAASVEVEIPEEVHSMERARKLMAEVTTLCASEIEVRQISALLWHALHSTGGADHRWTQRRERGLDDAALELAIKVELGEGKRSSPMLPMGYWETVEGASAPILAVNPKGKLLREHLRGQRLISWARALLEIPQPVVLAEV